MSFEELSLLFHYGTIALTVGITSIGVGIGEGLASSATLEAMNIQPSAKNDIFRTSLVGMALIDTAAIMGITVAAILLFNNNHTRLPLSGFAELGIACAICLSGLVLGLVSALPTQQAVLAIARQPFFHQKIFRFMLITQSIIQTPILFGFIVAMFIREQAAHVASLADSIRLISGGLCIGLGSIGPSIGLAHFAQTACKGLGVNRNAYNKLLSFTFISEAIIETPIIFALIISLLIIRAEPTQSLSTALTMLAAALSIGIGTIGAGIGSGVTAAAACNQIAHDPHHYGVLSRLSMFAQGLIDTNAIYALLISLFLLLLKTP